ncbi:hypothetical protein ANCCAN_18708 [Ancylostoma caninum]|uniref:Uncharacterized protein n=1 Tax=Ancylostoma caninum TaxID=29170 RepID=A0A368FTC0_ANCCA|nr:hypothetical protein ANCCAN_18708 [Ancylostoma caninum]
MVPAVAQTGVADAQQETDFVKSYTTLFNMKYEQWKKVEPIMLDELIEMLKDTRETIRNDSALMPADTSLSLISIPDDLPQLRRPKTGFRRVVSRAEASSNDLKANQEVMLINEYGKRQAVASPSRIRRSSQRLRLKDPVSRALSGDSIDIEAFGPYGAFHVLDHSLC